MKEPSKHRLYFTFINKPRQCCTPSKYSMVGVSIWKTNLTWSKFGEGNIIIAYFDEQTVLLWLIEDSVNPKDGKLLGRTILAWPTVKWMATWLTSDCYQQTNDSKNRPQSRSPKVTSNRENAALIGNFQTYSFCCNMNGMSLEDHHKHFPEPASFCTLQSQWTENTPSSHSTTQSSPLGTVPSASTRVSRILEVHPLVW